ncbi:MAG: hypothetical protein ABL864_04575 [Terricaulis sp.]
MEALLLFGIIIPLLTIYAAIPLMVLGLVALLRFLAALLMAVVNVITFAVGMIMIPDSKSMEAIVGIWALAGVMLAISLVILWNSDKIRLPRDES